MKLAFGTIVYKEAFKYYTDFIQSINNQTFKHFDILILNDNLDLNELQIISKSLANKTIFWAGEPNSKPYELRVELIKRAKLCNYDLLILGDFDDQFSENRVSEIVGEFDDSYCFYYNDIYHFDKKNKFFDFLPQYTQDISNILESNYLGLSNTALNLNKIDFALIDKFKKCSTSVFDWCMYSIILNQNLKGKKVDNCKTYYRIHTSNIAGESKNDYESILKEIYIKINHYSILKDQNLEFTKRYYRYLKIRDVMENTNFNSIKNGIEISDYWWSKINSTNERWMQLYDF